MKKKIEKLIASKLKTRGAFTAKDLQDEIGISRQAIHKHIKKMLEEGKIRKVGSTRGARYVKPEKIPDIITRLRRTYPIQDLQEDEVLQSVQLNLNLQSQINKNAREIFSYVFTEILNNAIDHSQSEKVNIQIALEKYEIVSTISDYGVGIYQHMKDRLGLPSEEASLRELLKGKATTDPERHTGEGLFFTSRSTDMLRIASHRLSLTFDNKINDIFTETIRFRKGTKVNFRISRNTKRKLTDSFNTFAGKEFDYTFSKTSVRVKLYSRREERFMSRSIAKRILHRLDTFEEVIIDFADVTIIGQGFADQIFRVFRREHPHVKIIPVNTTEAISAMIAHVSTNE